MYDNLNHPPVDIVYTWVDGKDDNWKAKKSKYFPDSVDSHDISDACRFESHDELLYSLRSVSQFATWINHIFIVTDQQVPKWLKLNDKITVVDHQDIFDNKECLPTFNSLAIESKLMHIPELEERFLYLNDDVFIGRETSFLDFFNSDGTPKIFATPEITKRTPEQLLDVDCLKKKDAYQHVLIRARQLVFAETGKIVCNEPPHVIKVFLKSELMALENTFAKEFQETANNKARTYQDIYTAALYSFYKQANGVTPTRVFRLNKEKWLNRIFSKPYDNSYYIHVGLNRRESKINRLFNMIGKIKPMQFCLNDLPGTKDATRIKMQESLESFYPSSSPFEKENK